MGETINRFSENDTEIEYNKFIKTTNLHSKSESTSKSLIENNKVVVGVYIRLYEEDEKSINTTIKINSNI